MKTQVIEIPDGQRIAEIIFEDIPKRVKSWYDLESLSGYYVSSCSTIASINKIGAVPNNKNVFSTKELAEAALAMAQLSQLRDNYREGWVPDFKNLVTKYYIYFHEYEPVVGKGAKTYSFFCFQTQDLANEFLENFRDLIIKAQPLFGQYEFKYTTNFEKLF